jgi:glycosyltransferase involved in cell wall biosynthesis
MKDNSPGMGSGCGRDGKEVSFDPRLPFVYHTHTGSPTGYAQSAWVLARAFWEAGLEVRYLFTSDDPLYEPPSPSSLVNSLRDNKPDLGLPQILYSVAPLFYHNSGAYKIGWSMMEVDGINADWAEACNAMDEVWVPTLWQSRFFVNSGVNVPVYTVPLGIDPRMFSPTVYQGKWEGPPGFKFLSVGWWQLRKRWDILVRAFVDEFQGQEDVHLILKIHSTEPDVHILHTLAQTLEGRELTNVHLVNVSVDWWKLASFYRMCDAFVLPTGGEGYGYPFLEALCCGLPVVATDGLGTGEILRSDVGDPYPGVLLLPSRREVTVVDHPYYAGRNWWVVNETDVRRAMREVYGNAGAWKAAALEGSKQARRERSCHVAAQKVEEHLMRIYVNHGPFPKETHSRAVVGLWSGWERERGGSEITA